MDGLFAMAKMEPRTFLQISLSWMTEQLSVLFGKRFNRMTVLLNP